MSVAHGEAQCHARAKERPLTAVPSSSTQGRMSSLAPADAGTLLKQPAFILFLLSRCLSRFASLIGIVAIGWQLYDLTDSAFALGLVGLVGFLPTALLVFVAGHAADRYERKRIMQLCQLAEALATTFLAWGAYSGWLAAGHIFIATFILGTTAAFEGPATSALLPLIAPQGSLQRATAMSSGAAQVATIAGPALGGLAYAVSPALAYAIMVLFWLLGTLLAGAIRLKEPVASGAVKTRCCRSMRATSCKPARPASVCCAPRPRSAHCSRRLCWRATPSAAAWACGCSRR
jgi:MFS family permease